MTTGFAMTQDLLITAQEMWPGSELVDARESRDDRPVRARYAVVPRASTPHALVPLDPPGAAAASLRRLSSASTFWDASTRLSAAAVARAWPRILRDRVEIRGGDPGLADYLAQLLGEPVTFSISIGTARVNRKPVLQVFDEQGQCRAFAKVAWSETTKSDVRAEGRALASLGDRKFRSLEPPALLARGSWGERPVLVTTALRPPAWTWSNRRLVPPVEAMEELASAFAVPDCTLAAAPWWERQWRTVGSLADQLLRGRMGRALDRVGSIAQGRVLAWGAWHGDWTPWNMARSRNGVLLWDWERFEIGVPRGLDPLHYVVNATAVENGPTPPDAVIAALASATRSDLAPHSEEHLLSLLYLVAITTRYVSLSEAEGGRHIAARGLQMLDALEQLAAT